MLRRGFTLIEILVVIAIIAILAAILFPVFTSARRAAHMTSCQARLYQLGHALELFQQERGRYPMDLSELSGVSEVAKGDVLHCPYPQTEGGEYMYILPQFVRGSDPPPAGTVVAYCVEHLRLSGEGGFDVPLRGNVTYLRFPNATGRADAKRIERYEKVAGQWQKVPEAGSPPSYPPAVWRFPGDPWPPEF